MVPGRAAGAMSARQSDRPGQNPRERPV